jgi:hypothetical protein
MAREIQEKNSMPRRYLAFDIETAKEVPGEDFNWRSHRPLGISCAATLASDSSEARLWHGKTTAGTPAPRMTPDDVAGLVRHLSEMVDAGFTILTWNGLGFDFDILAEESAALACCQEHALGHVDMMFHIVCSLGYPVALEKAAQGMALAGKPTGMTGLQAPKFWSLGRYKEVLDYVAQDVRMALQIAQAAEERRRFEWITRKGTKNTMPLSKGWLTARDALRLPEPDVSWMSNPLKRRDFTAWLPAS